MKHHRHKHLYKKDESKRMHSSHLYKAANTKSTQLNLKTYPKEQTINENEGVVFQCREESLIRASVRWARPNGKELPKDSIDDGNGRLTIPNIKRDDDGEYICETFGYPSSAKEYVYLTVKESHQLSPAEMRMRQPLKIKRFNDVYNIAQGEDFSLNCGTSGYSFSKVQWNKASEPFQLNVIQNGNILIIKNAQPLNSGVYVCIAESYGTTVKESTSIYIKHNSTLLETNLLEQVARLEKQLKVLEEKILNITIENAKNAKIIDFELLRVSDKTFDLAAALTKNQDDFEKKLDEICQN